VDTNERIRQQVSRLVDKGVSQKTLASKMGMTETKFSRWLNQKTDPPIVLTVAAMDGFSRYVHELSEAIREAEMFRGKPAGETPSGGGAARTTDAG
jgi:transcriptional regulator with XRE-family HTH domain